MITHEPSISFIILSALAAHPDGLGSHEMIHLLPDTYIPSAKGGKRGTAVTIKLGHLQNSGYIGKSAGRVFVRARTSASYDAAGGYLYRITPLGQAWLAAGCVINWKNSQRVSRGKAKRAAARAKQLSRIAAFLTARARGYGPHTQMADRPAICAELHARGLSLEQIGIIFNVHRERVRQYEDMYLSYGKYVSGMARLRSQEDR